MKKITLLLIMLLISMISCRSVSTKTSEDVKVDTDIGVTETVREDVTSEQIILTEIDKLRKELNNITVNWQKDSYSPPDSTGNQYILSSEKAVINNTTESSESSMTRSEEYIISIYNRLDSLESVIRHNMTSVTETESKEKPPWEAVLLSIALILILVNMTINLIKK